MTKDTTPPPPETRPNSFLEILGELNDGASVADLDRELRALVVQVRSTGKRGTLAFVLTVDPRGADTVVVTAEAKPKPPEEEKPRSIFYVGEGGQLLREHPKQTTLAFDEKAEAATE